MPAKDFPPTYREVAVVISAKIESGGYAPGSKLPSATVLAAEYGVSVSTAYRAIRVLQEAGLVRGRQGRGQYVRET